jgi:hypothetical protein
MHRAFDQQKSGVIGQERLLTGIASLRDGQRAVGGGTPAQLGAR